MIKSSFATMIKRFFNPSSLSSSQSSSFFAPSYTGKPVTEASAMTAVPVFACVKVISESMGVFPLIIYERDGRFKNRVTQGPLARLARRPNHLQSGFSFFQQTAAHLALWGNAYWLKQMQGPNVKGLFIIPPDRINMVFDDQGERFWIFQPPGGSEIIYTDQEVAHIAAFGTSGFLGLNPIAQIRQAVALANATEEYGARFFGNGATPGLIFEHPERLSDEVTERLRESLRLNHEGLDNSHKTMILEEGMKATQISIPPDDAQFLETRNWQLGEIARAYRVPSHKIGQLENATFSNIEEQNLQFVTETLAPYRKQIEQAFSFNVIPESRQDTFFAEFLVEELLSGDLETRVEAFSKAIMNGWMSAREVRVIENLGDFNPDDVYTVPLNMQNADSLVSSEDDDDQETSEENRAIADREKAARAFDVARSRKRITQSFQKLLKGTYTRLLKREIADIRTGLRKNLTRDVSSFSEFLIKFYRDFPAEFVKLFTESLAAFQGSITENVAQELGLSDGLISDTEFLNQFIQSLADNYAQSSLLQLQAILEEATLEGRDPGEAVDERLSHWEENRADLESFDQGEKASNAFSFIAYGVAGVSKLRWTTIGKNCPYCQKLEGKIVGIGQPFVRKGEVIQPNEDDEPFRKSYTIVHPPLHLKCDCYLTAVQEERAQLGQERISLDDIRRISLAFLGKATL